MTEKERVPKTTPGTPPSADIKQIVGGLVEGIKPPIAGIAEAVKDISGGVNLRRPLRKVTPEILTWQVIKERPLSFDNYKAFLDLVLCNDREAYDKLPEWEQKRMATEGENQPWTKWDEFGDLKKRRYLPYTDADAYRLLKVATEAFLIVNCGICLDKNWISEDKYQKLLDAVEAEHDVTKSKSATTAQTWWKEYSETVNGSTNLVLPYMLLIRKKLPELNIKQNIFGAETPFAGLNKATKGDKQAERCYGILSQKLLCPCMVELIWSYWHEEGMLVQTMNAISRRFQNVRGPADQDPLAMMEIDPLRPLNNLLWGYIQDEQHRLSVVRRAYEYDHHYGLSLEGKAVPPLRTADSRSQFLGAFHQLLHLASVFFKQDDDTTVRADGFPVLNTLRDLNMVLTEGMHNQFGDLPTTARIEMLMQQWLLARPEFREFLPRRLMVAYPEPWMDSVDSMKRLQGWTDTGIMHFSSLANYGEQILLSVRFTRWSEINDADMAAAWARLFRDEIQGYIHAYRAVTGVDLSAEITTTQQRELITTRPSVLLRQRLQGLRGAPSLPVAAQPASPQSFRERRAARR